MAKPIPTKKHKHVIAKKKQKTDLRVAERAEYVKTILDSNGEDVAEMVEFMVQQLRNMHQDAPVGGPRDPLFQWIAVRLLVSCAKWDIKIGNFTLPKKLCADCGTRVR